MESLHELEIIVILLAVVLALTTLAHRILLPYPILLVVGGLILGVVPGMPRIQLNPDLVFLVFLPPILWGAAYFTSWRDFRANLRPITWLAVGLVLVTTATGGRPGAWGPARNQLGRGGGAGGDRVSARRHRGDRHCPEAWHSATPRHDSRGREFGQ